jgi:hypothetical protein
VLGVVGAAPMTLRIVDLSGRAIRTLIDRGDAGTVPGSEATVVWDGRTDDGGAVHPGMYVAMLEANGRRTGRRIPFLR